MNNSWLAAQYPGAGHGQCWEPEPHLHSQCFLCRTHVVCLRLAGLCTRSLAFLHSQHPRSTRNRHLQCRLVVFFSDLFLIGHYPVNETWHPMGDFLDFPRCREVFQDFSRCREVLQNLSPDFSMFYQKLVCILLVCLQNFTAFSTRVLLTPDVGGKIQASVISERMTILKWIWNEIWSIDEV